MSYAIWNCQVSTGHQHRPLESILIKELTNYLTLLPHWYIPSDEVIGASVAIKVNGGVHTLSCCGWGQQSIFVSQLNQFLAPSDKHTITL